MTDLQKLEKKAKAYITRLFGEYDSDFTDVEQGYIAGAKENGVVWHDLQKDPNDLPDDNFFRITNYGIGFYERVSKQWYFWNGNKMVYPPVAWCELPVFAEE